MMKKEGIIKENGLIEEETNFMISLAKIKSLANELSKKLNVLYPIALELVYATLSDCSSEEELRRSLDL